MEDEQLKSNEPTSEAMDIDQSNTSNHGLKSERENDKPQTSGSSENNSQQSPPVSRRKMKKDDSGISIEKSTEEECSSDECTITQEGCSGNEIATEKIIPQKLDIKNGEDASGLNSPDSGLQDCSYSLPEIDSSSSGVKTLLQAAAEISKEASETKSESKSKGKSEKSSKKDKVKVSMVSEHDLSDSDDDLSVKSDDTCRVSGSDEEKNYDPTPNIPKPKYKWFLCQEVVDRQYGTSSKYAQDLFRLRCYGSLHMVERLELMYKMKKHRGCVNTLHFNSCGTRLVSGSDDLDVIIWDWRIAEPVLEYPSGHRSNVFQAKFMPLSGDCHIVSCARDGQVRLAELSTTGVCKSTHRIAQHRGAAHKLALQMDSPHTFLSCGEDAVVFEIDLRDGKPEKLVTCKENERKVPLYTIFVNPSNSFQYAVGGRDHFVRVYDKRFTREEDGVLKKICPQHLVDSDIRANVTCLVYNYNGSELLASYNDEDIYSFDTHNPDGSKYFHRYCGHRNNQTVKGVNYFGPKSEFVVSGSDCGCIYMWERETEHIVQYMHGDEGGVVNCLEPHPLCPILATSGLDDDIKIWVPSCEEPPNLSELKTRICANMKEREEDRKRDGPETFETRMLWFLMQQFRRARRRAMMEEHDGEESSSSESDSDNNEEDVDLHHAIQCTQS